MFNFREKIAKIVSLHTDRHWAFDGAAKGLLKITKISGGFYLYPTATGRAADLPQ